jgi:chromosome condensin MukBEF ATPase and DNA-binding subunit MukB
VLAVEDSLKGSERQCRRLEFEKSKLEELLESYNQHTPIALAKGEIDATLQMREARIAALEATLANAETDNAESRKEAAEKAAAAKAAEAKAARAVEAKAHLEKHLENVEKETARLQQQVPHIVIISSSTTTTTTTT